MNRPTKHDDIIDSRDNIAAIEELEAEQETLREELDAMETEAEREAAASTLKEWDECEGLELLTLRALQAEAEGYAADWRYGAALIRDSYFTDYAQELAEDIGAVQRGAHWPNDCIDWDQAADALKQDYTCVSFDGADYWVR